MSSPAIGPAGKEEVQRSKGLSDRLKSVPRAIVFFEKLVFGCSRPRSGSARGLAFISKIIIETSWIGRACGDAQRAAQPTALADKIVNV